LVPSFKVDVVDTTGAGDAFSGAVAWALASGFSPAEAVQLAAAAGALATEGVGAQGSLPTREQVFSLSGFESGRRVRRPRSASDED
jgi:sugar/nucleoside kinase (ribokinase family)